MSDLNTATFSKFVENKEYIYLKGVMDVEPEARESGIFKLGVWEAGTGDTKDYTEVELESFASETDEDEESESALAQEGYSKTVSPYRFTKTISISWQLRRRGKYDTAVNKLTNLGRLVANRYELDLQHRLTFGTATSYTTQDGKTRDISTGDTLALFYSAHTLTGSSSTYRNILANNPQLSAGSLESMEKMITENTLDNFGVKKVLRYDILWTTDDANTLNTARELMISTAKISAPNAGVTNVNEGKYKLVKLSYVNTDANGANDSTKAKYWGISSSEGTELRSDIEEAPTVTSPVSGSNAEVFANDSWKFKGSGSWSIVAASARGNSLSKGDGAA